MGKKKPKSVPILDDIEMDDDDPPPTCICGIDVNTGAYLVGFFGMCLSGTGLIASVQMNKGCETFIQLFSTTTYACVFIGRLTLNRIWYLPLLLVHALSIPFLMIVGLLIVLVNFEVVKAQDFPWILQLSFTLEFTKEGLWVSLYNAVTAIIELYFSKVVYSAWFAMKYIQPGDSATSKSSSSSTTTTAKVVTSKTVPAPIKTAHTVTFVQGTKKY